MAPHLLWIKSKFLITAYKNLLHSTAFFCLISVCIHSQLLGAAHVKLRWAFARAFFFFFFLRVMFYSVGIFRTSSPACGISSKPERTASRRRGDEPGYIRVLQQRAGSLNIKRLLLIKENQICQVKEFSAFLCMGRCKNALTEIIPLMCTSTIWGQYPMFPHG